MTELEQLRADIAAIKAVKDIAVRDDWCNTTQHLIGKLNQAEAKLAALEAEEAKKEKDDRWREAKSIFDEWEQSFKGFICTPARATEYVRHLESEVQRLEAELAKRPVVWCARDDQGRTAMRTYNTGVNKVDCILALYQTEEQAKKCWLAETAEPYTGEQS